MRLLSIGLALSAFAGAPMGWGETSTPNFRPIRVVDGVFRYPDGSEVTLYGTNYYPMAWYQFTHMKSAGADFRMEIARDVADMKAMGVDVVRVHFFDRQHTNLAGDLLEDEALTVFDMLVAELDRQGVYLFLTPLTWWSSPVDREEAFSAHTSKMGMMHVEEAVKASERFLGQLFTRRNPFTGRTLSEEPSLAVIEIFNEPWYWPYEAVSDPGFEPGFLIDQTRPEVYKRDLDAWTADWNTWLAESGADASPETYADFQHERMQAYLRRMIAAIRGAGAEQPVASGLFETYRNPGILRAIAESDVDAVTDGWYIGGFDTLHEGVNLLSDPVAQSYKLHESLAGKARMVYEWDVCRTYDTVAMYPAMTRRWRSMGAQIVCQFQYDPAINAPFNTDWGVHYLNLGATPAKAAAFLASARAFAQTPRGEQFPTEEDDVVFGGTAFSFRHNQVMHVTPDEVIHAHPISAWVPIELPESPARVTGRGISPYAEYTGSGLYRLERTAPDTLLLSTTRNAVPAGPVDKAFFDNNDARTPRVLMDINAETFTLRMPGWDRFTCTTESGVPVEVTGNSITVIPGEGYRLNRATE